jgi:hypothetical protein
MRGEPGRSQRCGRRWILREFRDEVAAKNLAPGPVAPQLTFAGDN